MNIVIEPMTIEHIPQVVEIEKQSFSLPWSKASFFESFSYDHAMFLVAVDYECTDIERKSESAFKKSRVAGYIGMYKVLNEGDITNIAVSPEYRGKGVGFALMNELKKLAVQRNIDNLILEVRESNNVAISLYKKVGFCPAGIRKNFYEKPVENAIVMYMKLLPL